MNAFDIYIAYVIWDSGGKSRPVLVLERQATVILVFNIATQYENKSEMIKARYFKINDWVQAGLNSQSYIDTNTVRELPPSALDGRAAIGKLSDDDVQKLIEFLSLLS